VLAISTSSFAAGDGKHKTAKQTAVKESKKKFANTDFAYDGLGSITSSSSWTQTTLSCPSGTNLCGITFDPNHTNPSYALDGSGKPNSTVLDIVNRLWNSTADGAEIIDGTTHTGIIVHKKA